VEGGPGWLAPKPLQRSDFERGLLSLPALLSGW